MILLFKQILIIQFLIGKAKEMFFLFKIIIYKSNRAIIQAKLDLFRRSIKDCDSALKLDPNCLRAYLIKGQCFKALNKLQEAEKTWKTALNYVGDLEIYFEIQRCLKGETEVLPKAVAPTFSSPEVVNSLTTGPLLSARGKLPSNFDNDRGLQLTSPETPQISLSNDESISASALVASKGLVQHGVGQKEIDEKIGEQILKICLLL